MDVGRLLNENKEPKFGCDIVNNKILNSSSMFLAQIVKDEVLNATSKLKGKFSVGYDEILETLVADSVQFIRNQ
jgi:phosphoribosylformylglycinamidine (FGAM) synthase-like amidotransferase family enzyme